MIIGVKSQHSIPEGNEETKLQNPFEIKPAMVFAIFFVALSIISILAQKTFGNSGLLILSAIIGVTDIDPFILSLVHHTSSIERVFVSAIIIAAMSNTIFKGIYFAFISKQLQKTTMIRYGIWAVLHLPLIIMN